MSLKILLLTFEVIHKLMTFISSLLQSIPLPRIWNSYPNYGFKSVFAFGHFRFVKLFPPVKDITTTTYGLETIMGMSTIFRQEGLFNFDLFNKKNVILIDPDLIKVVLNSTKEINKSRYYHFMQTVLGKGLITSNGDLWRKQRKLLNPMFHLGSIKEFVPMMNKHVKMMITQLQKDISKSDPKILDISDSIEQCAFNIIMDAIFDFESGNGNFFQNDYFEGFKRLEQSFSYRLTRPWLTLDEIFKLTALGKETVNAIKLMDDVFKIMLTRKKANIKEPDDNVRNANFMDIILQLLDKNPELMSEKQLRDECLTLIAAGYDTSATTTTFTLFMLGLYPEIQEKVYQELTSVCGTDIERDIEYADLKHLTYLEKVAKESLRLCPPLPLIARELTQDLKISEKILKKGVTCGILVQSVHRDPRHYPNPEVFDPDRFNPENNARRHPFAYIPFAAGPRNCIGQAFATIGLKVILANVLRHFRVTSQLARDKVIPAYDIVNKMHEMPLHFEPRNQKN